MKQKVLKFIYHYFAKNLRWFPEYTLETFHNTVKPAVDVLLTVDGLVLQSPVKVGEGFEYSYSQTGLKRLTKNVHIFVTIRIQDDGWEPYPVVSLGKCVHFHKDLRMGIGMISIEHIYPMQIPLLPKLIEEVADYTLEFRPVSPA
jgi:hypothetical protein